MSPEETHVCEYDAARDDFTGWCAMANAGLAERGRDLNGGRDAVFRATPLGRAVAAVSEVDRG